MIPDELEGLAGIDLDEYDVEEIVDHFTKRRVGTQRTGSFILDELDMSQIKTSGSIGTVKDLAALNVCRKNHPELKLG